VTVESITGGAAAQVIPPNVDPFYVPYDIKSKRARRTKATIAGIRDHIVDILSNDNPQTVRQVFYALTVRGAIAKAEIEYHRRNPRRAADGRAWLLLSAAKAIAAKGKPTYIYHFGDLDPSGVDAARDIEAKLRRYAPAAEIHFAHPAVTRAQVEKWNLPTRPTKQTDIRAKKFGSAVSVELDAIPAHKLRELVRVAGEMGCDPRRRHRVMTNIQSRVAWVHRVRPRRYSAGGRNRARLPYGKGTCADGREVLFDRDYVPIWQRMPRQLAEPADPYEWVPWVKQDWFFNDGNPPWHNRKTKARCEQVLREWGVSNA
jgi:hypothetical protein